METKNKRSEASKNIIYTFFTCLMIVGVALLVIFTTPGTPKEVNNKPVSTPKITFLMPVSGALIKDFSDTALKYNATLKQWEAHKAIDIQVPAGTDVVAVLDGKVLKVENVYLLGTVITLEHEGGLKTVYASLDHTPPVTEGQLVKRGDKIGIVAASAKGEAKDGPHLHFEVHKDGKKVNPLLYLEFEDK